MAMQYFLKRNIKKRSFGMQKQFALSFRSSSDNKLVPSNEPLLLPALYVWERFLLQDGKCSYWKMKKMAADNVFISYIDAELLTRASKQAMEMLGGKDIYYIFHHLCYSTSTKTYSKETKNGFRAYS